MYNYCSKPDGPAGDGSTSNPEQSQSLGQFPPCIPQQRLCARETTVVRTAPASFDGDDVGKPVVNDDADQIGRVLEIRPGTAYVDPNPSTFDTSKSKLGWENADEESYPLQDGQVAMVTDDEIILGEL